MDNVRRARFIAYFKGSLKGSRDLLMKKTGLTKGRVSQFFDESQAFGERAARNLAERLKLPPDYFEADQSSVGPAALSPQAVQVAQHFERLSDDERARFLRLLNAAQDRPSDGWIGDLGALRKAR